ncbi:hypothetical protein ACFWUW_30825 [Streptomyces sp. NPDC058655]|uniref:hypothetical protein n=1 Tax=Streptomyces sp. NPDC058655 TaxID=3346577 RepID=UPI00365028F9
MLCGQGAGGVFAGYHWYPGIAIADRATTPAAHAARISTVRTGRPRRCHPDVVADHDVSQDFVRAQMAAPGAQSALGATLRMDMHALMCPRTRSSRGTT